MLLDLALTPARIADVKPKRSELGPRLMVVGVNAIEVVPVEHLMLGSDSPFPLGEPDPVNFVRNALPADQVDLILNRNFDRLTGA